MIKKGLQMNYLDEREEKWQISALKMSIRRFMSSEQ